MIALRYTRCLSPNIRDRLPDISMTVIPFCREYYVANRQTNTKKTIIQNNDSKQSPSQAKHLKSRNKHPTLTAKHQTPLFNHNTTIHQPNQPNLTNNPQTCVSTRFHTRAAAPALSAPSPHLQQAPTCQTKCSSPPSPWPRAKTTST